MTIVPLASPCSAMPARFTTSTYQEGKSSDCLEARCVPCSLTHYLDYYRTRPGLGELDQQDPLPRSQSQLALHRRKHQRGRTNDRTPVTERAVQPRHSGLDVLEQSRLPLVGDQRRRGW